MNDNLKSLLLVDGSSYLFRAYHALPPLTNSQNEPTGAVYGVLNMLRRLISTHQPSYIGVVFDAKGKTFRNDLYDKYKATRPPMPDDLRAQIEPLHATIKALGYPLFVVPGVEADDVIGTLATQAEAANIKTIISTGDKDMAQLVTDTVTLINTMSNTTMDRDGVFDKFGVTPEQIIDYLALMGDSSDNIPGVPKVGPKTARKWLNQYSNLDTIISHSDDIGGKVGENLRNHLNQLHLSRQLATIKRDLSLPLTPCELIPSPQDTAALHHWYSRLEFKSWLKQLENGDTSTEVASTPSETQAALNTDYDTVFSQSDLAHWIKKLANADLFSFDLETTSLNYMDAEIVGISFAITPGQAAYVPVAHTYPEAPQQLCRNEVLDQLRPLLEDATTHKVGQNLKYDMNVLANYGIQLKGIQFDTMIESYVLDSTGSRHDMDTLALKHLGHNTIHYEDVAGKGTKQISFDQVDIKIASPYAAEDADITLHLHDTFWPRLTKIPALQQLFEHIEMPLLPVLSCIERTGVLIDVDMLQTQSHELAQRLLELEQEAHELAGESFNLSSPKQTQEILYNKLGLPILQKTPKGQPSTAESVLQELALDYPLPKRILEHRSLSKLKSTYTDKLPKQINQHTGRVHTSYHQAVAATGRLSSSDPNLQNIPIRSEEGRRIRQAFVSPPGYKILAADYSQIELRIMAHLSSDEGLLSAFKRGDDIHRATAAEIFSVTPSTVTTDQRRSAKAINFGLIYGMSAFGLARQLGINRSAAQDYVDLYFARYPGVQDFMERMRKEARKHGYVETVFGRRLHLPEINARNAQRRQYAERAAINAPMQGTAADIIKRAMLLTQQWLEAERVDARIIMQVHDELVFEVATDQVDDISLQIRNTMTAAAELVVPLVVDIGVGDNWDQAH